MNKISWMIELENNGKKITQLSDDKVRIDNYYYIESIDMWSICILRKAKSQFVLTTEDGDTYYYNSIEDFLNNNHTSKHIFIAEDLY